jgi:hypothetical protein
MLYKILPIGGNQAFLDSVRVYFEANGRRKLFNIINPLCFPEGQCSEAIVIDAVRSQKPDIILWDIDRYDHEPARQDAMRMMMGVSQLKQEFHFSLFVAYMPYSDANKTTGILHECLTSGADACLNCYEMHRWDACALDVFRSRSTQKPLVNSRELEILDLLSKDHAFTDLHRFLENYGSTVGHDIVHFVIDNLRYKFKTVTLHGMVGFAFRNNILN